MCVYVYECESVNVYVSVCESVDVYVCESGLKQPIGSRLPQAASLMAVSYRQFDEDVPITSCQVFLGGLKQSWTEPDELKEYR